MREEEGVRQSEKKMTERIGRDGERDRKRVSV
jgi:hypothetical protein